MGIFSIFNQIGRDVSSGLASVYKGAKEGATKFIEYNEGAGYELQHFVKTGKFTPFGQAIKKAENSKIPFLNISGKQLAQEGGSFIANAIPVVGSFGHLASHPNENIWDKASDIAFGILDVTGVGDLVQVAKKPIEDGIEAITKTITHDIHFHPPEIHPPKLPVTPLPHLRLPWHPPEIHPPEPIRRPILPILHPPTFHPPLRSPDIHPTHVPWIKSGGGIIIPRDIHPPDSRLSLFLPPEHPPDIHPPIRLPPIVLPPVRVPEPIRLPWHPDIHPPDIHPDWHPPEFHPPKTGLWGKLDKILHNKWLRRGLLGVGIGAPILGGLLAGGTGSSSGSSSGGSSSPTPSSPTPSPVYTTPPSPIPPSPPSPSPSTITTYMYPSSLTNQSADVINPYSPQAQYYSAMAQQTPASSPSPSSPSPSTTSSTQSSLSNLISNPIFLIGIFVVFIIIIILLVR